jgi:magnesium-transporting ATPase (P-type)
VSDVNKIKVLGNPTEGALLLWLRKNGIDYIKVREENEVLDELPFSTERKYMATVVRLQSERKSCLLKVLLKFFIQYAKRQVVISQKLI